MNGSLTTILTAAVTFLLSIVVALIAFILKQHQRADDEHRRRIDKEIDLLRQRVHNFGNRVSELITRARWIDEDKETKK